MSLGPITPEAMLVGALNDVRGQRGAIASLALNFGIDAFDRIIPFLSLSTGMTFAELVDASTLCREALDPAQPTVKRQHLVTRSILKNFSIHQNNGYRLRSFDITAGLDAGTVSVRNSCVVENYIKLDSQRTEDHWGRLETKFPAAIATIENGSLFTNPEMGEVVKNILALHFARSYETLANTQRIRAPGIGEFMGTVGLNDVWLNQAHVDRFGFAVTDMGLARERVEAAVTQEFEIRNATGIFFRLRIPDFLQRASDIIARSSIQILRPLSIDDEFLIGDNPLITPNEDRSSLGTLDGVPIGNASTVIMPLSPRITVALANTESDILIGRDDVNELNQFQIRKAKKTVFFRPGSPLEAIMHSMAPPGISSRWNDESS